MSKLPPEEDLFGSDRDAWIGQARQAQYKLESVRNSYVGNKRKMLVDFAAILYDLGLYEKIANGGKVLDLFSGSAFVGYFFKSMGASVWSNELLASSYLNALVLVENQDATISKDELQSFFELRDTWDDWIKFPGAASALIGTRFTQSEALLLDTFAANIQKSFGWTIGEKIKTCNYVEKIHRFGNARYENTPSLHGWSQFADDMISYKIGILAMSVLHQVMNRCYVGGRLNNGQVLAKLEHRLQHQRNEGSDGIPFHAINPYSLSFDNGRYSIATKMDAMELLTLHKPQVDMIYIDPPYGGDQSDYSGMYEFFEDYVGCPKPASADRFVKSKKYGDNFDELLSALPKEPVWIFSYNDDSWANIDEIKSHLKSCNRREIIVKEVDYKYNYRSKEKASGTEYVIVSVP